MIVVNNTLCASARLLPFLFTQLQFAKLSERSGRVLVFRHNYVKQHYTVP